MEGFRDSIHFGEGIAVRLELLWRYSICLPTSKTLLIKHCSFRFLVDDIPIRQYLRKSAATFPLRPMWAYGSIWDASDWATENGRYRVDYRYQPFVARFTKFKVGGCSAYSPSSCRPLPASPSGWGLSPQQYAAMRWAQNNHMVYDYCSDSSRDHSLTPEC